RELRRLDWVVYAKPPFAGPEQVLAYLGRYTHRVAIANSRLLSLADGKISFTWKDYRAAGKTKVMTLNANEFIRRFLLHALPDGSARPRHYGFLANGSRGDSLALCRRLLEARLTSAVREPADNHTPGDRPLTAADFAICPDCGGTMRRIAVVPRYLTFILLAKLARAPIAAARAARSASPRLSFNSAALKDGMRTAGSERSSGASIVALANPRA